MSGFDTIDDTVVTYESYHKMNFVEIGRSDSCCTSISSIRGIRGITPKQTVVCVMKCDQDRNAVVQYLSITTFMPSNGSALMTD